MSVTGDLHCHTTLSDGSLGIEEVIIQAKRMGLDYLSLTDHDTLSSSNRAHILGERYGVKIIPGVELSVELPLGLVEVVIHPEDESDDDNNGDGDHRAEAEHYRRNADELDYIRNAVWNDVNEEVVDVLAVAVYS